MSSRGSRASGDRTGRPERSSRDCVVFGPEEGRFPALTSRSGTLQGAADDRTRVRELMPHSWDMEG